MLAAENPHKPYTAAAQWFAIFKSGMQVEEFVASVGEGPGRQR